MTSADEHIKKIRELLESIRYSIDVGIEKRPVIIGFSCSECSIQLVELYLHKLDKIPTGKLLKHSWFKPPQAGQKKETIIERKLQVDFPNKKQIYNLIYGIEKGRTALVYGKSSKKQIELVLESFNKLKDLLIGELKKMGVEIE